MVKRALGALRKVTPNVIGAVLNAVDVKTQGLLRLRHYGSRKERTEKGAGRAPRGPAPAPDAATPVAEVTDASIV